MSLIPSKIKVLRNLQEIEQMSEEQLNQQHPLYLRIHRRVNWINGDKYAAKQSLSMARISEFTIDSQNQLCMVDLQGLSCTCTCHCVYNTQSGYIPITFLEGFNELKISESLGEVMYENYRYPIQLCFSRTVCSDSENSVSYGKDDRCLIDEHFSLFFKTSEHGLICLRNPLQLPNPYVTYESGKSVLFHSPYFDLDTWTECGTKFVVIPNIVFQCIITEKSFESEIAKKNNQMNENIIRILRDHFVAFPSAKINELLNKSFSCHPSEWTANEREDICNILQDYDSHLEQVLRDDEC